MNVLLTIIMTISAIVTICSSGMAQGRWPPRSEIWIDGGSNDPAVQVVDNRLVIRVLQGTAAETSCVVADLKSEPPQTFMIQQECFSEGEPRYARLQSFPVIPNIWVIDENSQGPKCRTVMFELNSENLLVSFDRNLPRGCYSIIYQSALLKHPRIDPVKEPTTRSIQVEQR